METNLFLMICCYTLGVVWSTSINVNEDELINIRQELLLMKEDIRCLQNDKSFLQTDVNGLKTLTEALMETVRMQNEKINALQSDKEHMKAESTDLMKLLNMKQDSIETELDVTDVEPDNADEIFDFEDVATNRSSDQVIIESRITTEKRTRPTNSIKPKRQNQRQMVAFSGTVTPADLEHLGHGQIIHFDEVISNLGNAYDSKVAIFRVPVQGWYVLSLTLMSNPKDSQALSVFVNGISIFHCYTGGDEYTSASRTIVTHANNGDDVWVQTSSWQNGDTVHGFGHTSFTAFLLYAD